MFTHVYKSCVNLFKIVFLVCLLLLYSNALDKNKLSKPPSASVASLASLDLRNIEAEEARLTAENLKDPSDPVSRFFLRIHEDCRNIYKFPTFDSLTDSLIFWRLADNFQSFADAIESFSTPEPHIVKLLPPLGSINEGETGGTGAYKQAGEVVVNGYYYHQDFKSFPSPPNGVMKLKEPAELTVDDEEFKVTANYKEQDFVFFNGQKSLESLINHHIGKTVEEPWEVEFKEDSESPHSFAFTLYGSRPRSIKKLGLARRFAQSIRNAFSPSANFACVIYCKRCTEFDSFNSHVRNTIQFGKERKKKLILSIRPASKNFCHKQKDVQRVPLNLHDKLELEFEKMVRENKANFNVKRVSLSKEDQELSLTSIYFSKNKEGEGNLVPGNFMIKYSEAGNPNEVKQYVHLPFVYKAELPPLLDRKRWFLVDPPYPISKDQVVKIGRERLRIPNIKM